MSDDAPLVATPSQTVGPFFHFGLTREPNGRPGSTAMWPFAGALPVKIRRPTSVPGFAGWSCSARRGGRKLRSRRTDR